MIADFLLNEVVERALAEDLSGGDVTSMATVAAEERAIARAVAHSELTVCGGAVFARAFYKVDPGLRVEELLAEGSRRAADAIGHDSIAFAPQVKGLEIPGYEPRALQTMALGFAVGARGADHNRSGAYEVDFSEKVDRRNATLDSVRHAIDTEDKAALMQRMGQKQLHIELAAPLMALPASLAHYPLELGSNQQSLVYTYDTNGERTGIVTLLNDLRAAGLQLTDLQTRQSSLEDIFVGLLREQA